MAREVPSGDLPEELTELNRELEGVTRRVEQRIEPGSTALKVSIAMLVLIVSLLLPWTGTIRGWQVLSGIGSLGSLPQLFTLTSLGFGLVVSSLALATRLWGLAWLAAAGCGVSVITGVWAIWSRQTGVLSGGTGPGIGLILALLTMIFLVACWVRIAFRRG
ncbi:MAG: hypothetical protein QOG20_3679 [Pseudonocardiales bacterium]|jgi:hypothetical protein|uniref:Rv2732c family membrane protein n=1 Tax=Pseudonocardia sp. TaxID=60912 RepID=UPI00260555B6|nr:hypothetical protein [Pseudonocardia sp.]MCW2721989.1 hypothetical protein [Pseudonocardia sp.]MDT7613375.1 hypothetical protein [Pseudonocardiales bacterium]MDT7708072.1 hypothetical protein [Pseudonocardiales bacterium]